MLAVVTRPKPFSIRPRRFRDLPQTSAGLACETPDQQVALPAFEAGDLGGPAPEPRTAQITRADCFYYGCGSPPTVTVTVASSVLV
jgi:hypothetical protein